MQPDQFDIAAFAAIFERIAKRLDSIDTRLSDLNDTISSSIGHEIGQGIEKGTSIPHLLERIADRLAPRAADVYSAIAAAGNIIGDKIDSSLVAESIDAIDVTLDKIVDRLGTSDMPIGDALDDIKLAVQSSSEDVVKAINNLEK